MTMVEMNVSDQFNEGLLLEVYWIGCDPLITAINGRAPLHSLNEIEEGLAANGEDYLQLGEGLYIFEASYSAGQFGFEGRCEIAPDWELSCISFTKAEDVLEVHP